MLHGLSPLKPSSGMGIIFCLQADGPVISRLAVTETRLYHEMR